MNLHQLSFTGPYTHENLSIFLLTGADALEGSRFIPLDAALKQKCVTVHETGNVGQLEVENLSEDFDLYIQTGDVVKGGRQDRTLGVDFVFAKSALICEICGRLFLSAGGADFRRSEPRTNTYARESNQ